MSVRTLSISLAAASLVLIAGAAPTQALTMHECSAKYQAAKKADALNGMKWNDFRKAECGPNASATLGSGTATVSGSTAAAPGAATGETTSSINSILGNLGLSGTQSSGSTVFPSSVSQQYSNQSPGKARMLTCLDQYRTNKANGGNGGLNWIEKGGGYYSECNKRLKGS
ncbi:hypothetical protein [Chelativorans sp. AA-79]|uniref:hypothetical protein n=1 Tax=Chelativorans sp. AA-79 TaxID=3028735 RepID=UPI0023F787CD|nr:hypothetical protein [Chelativorans sp. AA-79]WEX10457.1 hypothetical protein PVE73_05725 [Chelativorans sp. AA-79]